MHKIEHHCKRFGHNWANGECLRCHITQLAELQRLLGEAMKDLVKINELF